MNGTDGQTDGQTDATTAGAEWWDCAVCGDHHAGGARCGTCGSAPGTDPATVPELAARMAQRRREADGQAAAQVALMPAGPPGRPARPKWVRIADESVGVPYGHVPGHDYHDVDCEIYRRGSEYRVDLRESWGSAQGYDEEHGRREASGYGDTVAEAASEAKAEAETAGMDMSWVVQAITKARRAADETEDDDE